MGFLSASSPKIILHCVRPFISGEIFCIPESPKTPDAANPWTCIVCANVNDATLEKCPICGVKSQNAPSLSMASTPSPQKLQKAREPNQKQKPCPACTYLNHCDLQSCEMCDAKLPEWIDPEDRRDQNYIIKLSFRNGGMSEFLKFLQKALGDRAWEVRLLIRTY